MKHIGNFEIKSGEVVVSDPCYERGTWCAGTLENVKNGTWKAYIKIKDEGRPGELIVLHEIASQNERSIESWNRQSFEVGVDSGQAGVFDTAHYQKDEDLKGFVRKYKDRPIDEEKWYTMACDRTLCEDQAGVIPFGAVSSSGYGDGGYTCYALFEKNEIIGIGIMFIGDNDYDDEEYDG